MTEEERITALEEQLANITALLEVWIGTHTVEQFDAAVAAVGISPSTAVIPNSF